MSACGRCPSNGCWRRRRKRTSLSTRTERRPVSRTRQARSQGSTMNRSLAGGGSPSIFPPSAGGRIARLANGGGVSRSGAGLHARSARASYSIDRCCCACGRSRSSFLQMAPPASTFPEAFARTTGRQYGLCRSPSRSSTATNRRIAAAKPASGSRGKFSALGHRLAAGAAARFMHARRDVPPIQLSVTVSP